MKIFSDLDIVDHTGHGVPIIIEKYGRDAFEISDNHIIVTIPFDLEVMKTINVGVNLNKNERQIIELILNDPTLTAEKLSIKINKTKRTARRYFISASACFFVIIKRPPSYVINHSKRGECQVEKIILINLKRYL